MESKKTLLPAYVLEYVNKYVKICKPSSVHYCDGSKDEQEALTALLLENGTLEKLEKYDNCFLARTSPADVARVESKTFMCTPTKELSVPLPLDPTKGQLGNWCNDKEMDEKLSGILEGCMHRRVMYVLTFAMGPVGSPYAKIGVQLTDSAYVVLSMRTMTSMGSHIEAYLDENFVKCFHSVNCPLTEKVEADPALRAWPCNPDSTLITHFPLRNEIISVGSGYGGNSLLGKKCFALRLAGNLAHKEGWLAEHMLIMGLESPQGEKKYVAASFPSACGKTNLAMMTPSIPGWKVTCVGDDIAWMRFDKNGVLRAINPEKGFFGVAPGTSKITNPVAMQCIFKDTIFTNVAKTSEGGVFWEGLENEVDLKNIQITDWLGNTGWVPSSGHTAAHPNSRFCAPIRNCPILDEHWDDPEGVPISAIIFGGRRPEGVPLVYEAHDWNHGVFIGASLKSETTSAASDMKANVITHDPFAMRPFMGYNAGEYISHWLKQSDELDRKLPKIFHVNWFLKKDGKYLWPGFGENIRVLKWIFDRCSNKVRAVATSIGYIPERSTFDLSGGLENVDLEQLLKVEDQFLRNELNENRNYFRQFLNASTPQEILNQLTHLEERLESA